MTPRLLYAERIQEEVKEQNLIGTGPFSGSFTRSSEIFKEKISKLEAELKAEFEEKRTLKEQHLRVVQKKHLLKEKIQEKEVEVVAEQEKSKAAAEKVNVLIEEKKERLAEHQVC